MSENLVGLGAFRTQSRGPWHNRASQDRCEGPEATLTLSDLDEAQQDDQGQCQEFGGSEGVLDPGGSLHAVTVHGREQHCGDRAE